MTTEGDTEIRPFAIDVPEAALVDLRERLARTRWPDRETVDDWSQGIPLAYVQELCAYWAKSYDWRRCETALNGWGSFRTQVDGGGEEPQNQEQNEAVSLAIGHRAPCPTQREYWAVHWAARRR